jgi:hypothetical protein
MRTSPCKTTQLLRNRHFRIRDQVDNHRESRRFWSKWEYADIALADHGKHHRARITTIVGAAFGKEVTAVFRSNIADWSLGSLRAMSLTLIPPRTGFWDFRLQTDCYQDSSAQAFKHSRLSSADHGGYTQEQKISQLPKLPQGTQFMIQDATLEHLRL